MFMMVFFEPQTGLIKRQAWASNFYQHRLRNSIEGAGYTIPWLEENIKKATVTDNGLVYSRDFYTRLKQMEEKANRDIKRMVDRFPDSVDQIPRLQNGELYHGSAQDGYESTQPV
jgi:hypothetical protein